MIRLKHFSDIPESEDIVDAHLDLHIGDFSSSILGNLEYITRKYGRTTFVSSIWAAVIPTLIL